MANFQDHNILDYEQDFKYNLRGDALLGPCDQEEEPIDQKDYESDVGILEEDDVQPHLPAESPAEQEEQGLFTNGNRNIFEQDDTPFPSPQSSLYGMS